MTINVHAKDIEMTPAIKAHAEDRAQGLEKFFDGIVGVDVTVGMEGQHHNKGKVYFCEMNVSVPGNKLVVSKHAEDLYKAIDKVKDHLKVEFEKLKGKMRNKDRRAIRNQRGYQEE